MQITELMPDTEIPEGEGRAQGIASTMDGLAWKADS
jgi:hypothetical protein